jgi:hypothetical protein
MLFLAKVFFLSFGVDNHGNKFWKNSTGSFYEKEAIWTKEAHRGPPGPQDRPGGVA